MLPKYHPCLRVSQVLLTDIFTLYFLPESPTQKKRYANNFLPALPIFPGSSRSLVQRDSQVTIPEDNTDKHHPGISTSPSQFLRFRPLRADIEIPFSKVIFTHFNDLLSVMRFQELFQ